MQTSEVTEEVGAPAAAMVRAEGVKARSVHIPCTPHMRVEPPRCPETGSTPCIPEELCHSRQVPLEEAAMVAGGEGLDGGIGGSGDGGGGTGGSGDGGGGDGGSGEDAGGGGGAHGGITSTTFWVTIVA